VVAADTAISDIDRDSQRLEIEIEAVRAREDRDRNLLRQGVGVRQVSDLEHELDTLKRRQTVLEDELLELMERRETADADAAKAREDLAPPPSPRAPPPAPPAPPLARLGETTRRPAAHRRRPRAPHP